MPNEQTITRLVSLARFARDNGYGVLSTGEQLAAALVLNRADWLKDMDYTIGQAIYRLDEGWPECIPYAERILRQDDERRQEIAAQLHNTNLTQIGLFNESAPELVSPGIQKLHDQDQG